MKRKSIVFLIGIISFVVLYSGIGFAQEEGLKAESLGSDFDSSVKWLWGEIISVDSQNGSITVKYIDYETDNEKMADIYVDDSTEYENVTSIEEIIPQDGISVDYVVDIEGKYMAKNVCLEKIEESSEPQEISAIE